MGEAVSKEMLDLEILQCYAENRYDQGLLLLVQTYFEVMKRKAASMIQGKGGWADLVQYLEDIVHDALIKVDDSLRKCDDSTRKARRLAAWVKRNVRWMVSDYRRELLACRRRLGDADGPGGTSGDEPENGDDPAGTERGESIEEAQRRTDLFDMQLDYQRASATLKERERQVLGRRMFGCTFKEIGRDLRLNPPTVATLHYRAIETLKIGLE